MFLSERANLARGVQGYVADDHGRFVGQLGDNVAVAVRYFRLPVVFRVLRRKEGWKGTPPGSTLVDLDRGYTEHACVILCAMPEAGAKCLNLLATVVPRLLRRGRRERHHDKVRIPRNQGIRKEPEDIVVTDTDPNPPEFGSDDV